MAGYKIIVWTDQIALCSHKACHDSQRVMHQRLLLEEYGADIHRIEGTRNVVAETLSRLDFDSSEAKKHEGFNIGDLENVNDFDKFKLTNITRMQIENRNECEKGTLREEPCGTTLYVHKDRINYPKSYGFQPTYLVPQ